MLDIVVCNPCTVSHLILARTLGNRDNYYHPHFADEAIEHREVKQSAQGHTAGSSGGQGIRTRATKFTTISSFEAPGRSSQAVRHWRSSCMVFARPIQLPAVLLFDYYLLQIESLRFLK